MSHLVISLVAPTSPSGRGLPPGVDPTADRVERAGSGQVRVGLLRGVPEVGQVELAGGVRRGPAEHVGVGGKDNGIRMNCSARPGRRPGGAKPRSADERGGAAACERGKCLLSWENRCCDAPINPARGRHFQCESAIGSPPAPHASTRTISCRTRGWCRCSGWPNRPAWPRSSPRRCRSRRRGSSRARRIRPRSCSP